MSRSHGALVITLLLAASAPGSAVMNASSCVPHLLGADRRGPARAIELSGDLAYLGSGAALQVVDVSDPWQPRRLSFLNLDGVVIDLALGGSIVVALLPGSLTFVDVSDSSRPVQVGSYPLPESPLTWSVAAAGHLAFVPRDTPGGLLILDFSDPAHPAELATFATAWANDVAIHGDRAFLSGDGGLIVLDISDPAYPTEVTRVDVAGGSLALSPSGTRLVDYGGGCAPHHDCGWAQLVDVADPAHPVLRETLWFSDTIDFAAISGGLAYLVEPFTEKVWIYDINDLAAPVRVGSLEARAAQLAADPPYLHLAAGKEGLQIFRLLDPARPQEIGGLATPGRTYGGFMAGPFAVTVHEKGIRTFDLSDPAAPRLAGALVAEGHRFGSIARTGTHAWVSTFSEPIRVFDVSDPTHPVFEATVGPSTSQGFVLEGELGFVYRYEDGSALTILDVEDPVTPVPLASLGDAGAWWNISSTGSRLYAWDGWWQSTLRIFDLADPVAPELLSTTTGLLEDVSRPRGDRLYYVGGDLLSVLDVRDPARPEPAGSLQLPSGVSGLELLGSRAHAMAGGGHDLARGEIFVADADAPGGPSLLGRFGLVGPGWSTFFAPGLLVVADGPAGISVYDSCSPFVDGFESGDTSAWSETRR